MIWHHTLDYFPFYNYSIGDPMPVFQDEICPLGLVATKCIQVTFPNGIIDFLILTRLTNESSIYEGYLAKEKDVWAVMIETPHENRLVGDFSFIVNTILLETIYGHISFRCLLLIDFRSISIVKMCLIVIPLTMIWIRTMLNVSRRLFTRLMDWMFNRITNWEEGWFFHQVVQKRLGQQQIQPVQS